MNRGSLIKRFNTVLLYCIDFPWQIYAASQCFQYTYTLFVRCHTHERLIPLRAFIRDFTSRTAEFSLLLRVPIILHNAKVRCDQRLVSVHINIAI